MGFDFSSFFGGLVEGAGEQVEKRNKEIRETTNNELENLYRKAEEQNKKNLTQREKLKETAQALSSYRGMNNAGLTDTQIIGLLQNPHQAKKVMEVLDKRSKEGTIDTLDFNEMFKVAEGKTDKTWQDFVATTTAPPKAAPSEEKKALQDSFKTRTAFGLGSTAGVRAAEQFEKVAGKSVAQLRAEAAGPSGVAEADRVAVSVNWSQVAEPESNEKVKLKLRDNIAKGLDLNDPANKDLLKKLQANSIIETVAGDKPRTAADIRAVFRDSLRAGMDPFIVKGVVRVDPQSGDFVPITGDADSIKQFVDHKNKIIENQARSMGLIDKDNRIIGGRDSFDALIPHANIKDGRIVSWKGGTESEAPKAEKNAAPAAAPAAPKVNPNPVPIPKTADGKIDGTKLLPGQKYVSGNDVKIWNGMNWQDAK